MLGIRERRRKIVDARSSEQWALRSGPPDVFSTRHGLRMEGLDAGRVLTEMVEIEPRWDWPPDMLIGPSMSDDTPISCFEVGVALGILLPCPPPAIRARAHFDVGPEACAVVAPDALHDKSAPVSVLSLPVHVAEAELLCLSSARIDRADTAPLGNSLQRGGTRLSMSPPSQVMHFAPAAPLPSPLAAPYGASLHGY